MIRHSGTRGPSRAVLVIFALSCLVRAAPLLLGCVVLGTALACVPWAWRNYQAFHRLLFIRSNFGLELRIANHDRADADIDVTAAREKILRHPSQNIEEAEKVRGLGEVEYMRQARQEAMAWIRGHPGEFTRLTLMRVAHFWCGPLRRPWMAAAVTTVTILALLGLRHRLPTLTAPQRAAILVPLATFPLVYYLAACRHAGRGTWPGVFRVSP